MSLKTVYACLLVTINCLLNSLLSHTSFLVLDPMCYVNVANALSALEKHSEALEYCQQAVNVNNSTASLDAHVYIACAIALIELKRY